MPASARSTIATGGLTMLPLLALRKLWLSLRGESPDKGTTVLQRGLVPPGRFADAVLTAMMQLETGAIRNPPLGTSLLYVGQAASSQPVG